MYSGKCVCKANEYYLGTCIQMPEPDQTSVLCTLQIVQCIFYNLRLSCLFCVKFAIIAILIGYIYIYIYRQNYGQVSNYMKPEVALKWK